MQTKYWYVYKRLGGPPIYRHTSYDNAVQEAQRLVNRVGGEFEILEARSIVKAAPRWIVETLYDAGEVSRAINGDDSNIPF